MKRVHFAFLLAMLAPLAHADDLQAAAAALNNKAYPEALRLYSQAANAGNAEAQLRLGEMYFYGSGVPVDEKTAQSWFQKSAAQGNAEASAAIKRVALRHARAADIAYWTSKYDGADLTQGRFACAEPVIPEVSTTNAEISKVSADYSAWRDCHNGFVDNLGAVLPLGKQIPSDVEELMTDEQMDAARSHLADVYKRVGAPRTAAAAATVARFDAWNARTTAQVATINEERKRRIDEQNLANTRDFARTDGGNPIGSRGATKNGGGR
jgi:TPR repeat protein